MTAMKKLFTLYGESPLHLLAFLASFALTGYAATALIKQHTLRVVIWFIGAAVGHDALLLPLYGLADLSLLGIWRRAPRENTVPWLNYIRFPGAISLVLLLIYFPEISRRRTAQFSNSGLTNHPYFSHWLLITGILFGLSAVTYAVQLRRGAHAGKVAAKAAAASTAGVAA
jgi:hypothetical protein